MIRNIIRDNRIEETIHRSRIRDKQRNAAYEVKDFLYNTLCCYKAKSNARESRYERYIKFKNEAKEFNMGRD